MALPAVSVLANERGQAMLFREGGWSDGPVLQALTVRPTRMGTAILADGRLVGLAPRSALSSLASCKEFFLGEASADGVRTVAEVRLLVELAQSFTSTGVRP